MKCVVYISRVVTRRNGARLPTGLSAIYSAAKTKNASQQISGVLSYRKGFYIQVIEGEDTKVTQLFDKISADERHTQVTLLLNTPISHRSFSGWELRLDKSINRDKEFQLFMERYTSLLIRLPVEKLALLNVFYNSKAINRKPFQTKSFVNKNIRLLAWPDFTVVKQSPLIIELCALLANAPQSYNNLVGSGTYGTKVQLDHVLWKFESLDILETAVRTDKQAVNHKPTGGFYQKMKTYLGLVRQDSS